MSVQDEIGTTPRESALTQFLSQQDVACPRCRFNLRGIDSNRCPECGHALSLGITPIAPFDPWWTCGAVSLSIGAGIGLGAAILTLLLNGWMPTQTWSLTGGFVFVHAAALAGWIHWRAGIAAKQTIDRIGWSITVILLCPTLIGLIALMATV